MHDAPETDVCLIVEGAYPFVQGGVSAWTHGLIEAQSDLRFSLVAITPDETLRRAVHAPPHNLSRFDLLPLHVRPAGRRPAEPATAAVVAQAALRFMRSGSANDLHAVLQLLASWQGRAKAADFLDSEGTWRTICASYEAEMPEASFLHYFWSLRSLYACFLATMLAPLPRTRIYHAISTGYAGLLAARAHIETGRPALLTEHGIYTNERRIEIASADWLHDRAAHAVHAVGQRTLKDIWTDSFAAYARAAYQTSERIVTLFAGNREMQIRDGAPRGKCLVIPNGIDTAAGARILRNPDRKRRSVALIGRVVPIKDVKTYLRACRILADALPDLEACVLGPMDEDPDYAQECLGLARDLRLEQVVKFPGRVRLEEWLPRIDVNVLTSVSEAQPLAVLEAGAAGVPTVATDVGACREMILGAENETPPLGAGGAVTPLGDPLATAEAIALLLTDATVYGDASRAIRARVTRYYDKARMNGAYRKLYAQLADVAPTRPKATSQSPVRRRAVAGVR